MFKNGEDCGRMKVITDKNREYMRTIIKFAVVSVLALFSKKTYAEVQSGNAPTDYNSQTSLRLTN